MAVELRVDNELETKLELCRTGKHPLEKVYISDGGEFDPDHVVRWCPICGAVVVDLDFDGRTSPGALSKMKSPLIAKNY